MVLYKWKNSKPKKFLRRLNFSIEERKDFTFAKYTTYGLGGKAKRALFPKNSFQTIVSFCKAQEGKSFILGAGSNVLASDFFYDGTVICTKNYSTITMLSPTLLYCSSGVMVGKLLTFCKEHSLGGLEYLAGIPATVGGLAFMNGGIANRYIADNILAVWLYCGHIVKLSNKKAKFAYKHSTMCDINAIILGVTLQVFPKKQEDVQKDIDRFLALRSHLPKGRSCGCVFKNIPLSSFDEQKFFIVHQNQPLKDENQSRKDISQSRNDENQSVNENELVDANFLHSFDKGMAFFRSSYMSAGKIIDMANLKGFRWNNAYVSDVHANFIISVGNSSRDVFHVIQFVKQTVYDKFFIRLEEEVITIGDFYDFDS